MVEAKEDSIDIGVTFGGEVTLLPDLESIFWLDLSFAFAGFTIASETDLTLVPTTTATQVFRMEYEWQWLTIGSKVNLELVPPVFQSLSVYADLSILDMTLGENDPTLALAADLGVEAILLPVFTGGTLTFDLTAGIGPLTVKSSTELGFAPFAFQAQGFEGKLSFLESTLEEWDGAPTLSGALEATLTVLPTVSSNLGLDFSFAFGALTATSETEFEFLPLGTGTQLFTLSYTLEGIALTSITTFDLAPYGFDSQKLKIELTFDTLSFYGWGTFTLTGLETGVGFTYVFP